MCARATVREEAEPCRTRLAAERRPAELRLHCWMKVCWRVRDVCARPCVLDADAAANCLLAATEHFLASNFHENRSDIYSFVFFFFCLKDPNKIQNVSTALCDEHPLR